MNYRKLLFDDFELNGYEPDIKCADGMDALTVAMAESKKQTKDTISPDNQYE